MTIDQTLRTLFNAGITAVSGKQSVFNALSKLPDFKPDSIIAIGKAASDMLLGAQLIYGPSVPALIATKHGHPDPTLRDNSAVSIIESGHPIPDEQSLLAGGQILKTVASMPAGSALLLLVSGGASALAECLPEEISLQNWQALNEELISAGLDIEQINARRKAVSRIKDGQLLSRFHGHEVVVCAISDVKGDDISIIGSGIGDARLTSAVQRTLLVASNRLARDAVNKKAIELGFKPGHNSETLYADVYELAVEIGRFLRQAKQGVYIWGGEPTIVLPVQPGNGGRNQSLALALAKEIFGQDNIHILVAGTDGTDGPTGAAGGIIDGSTWRYPADAQRALEAANAGEYLERVGSRFVTGPTGTNVMDLLIAIVE